MWYNSIVISYSEEVLGMVRVEFEGVPYEGVSVKGRVRLS